MDRLRVGLAAWLIMWGMLVQANEEITPYKFKDSFAQESVQSSYVIPASSRFTVKRCEPDAPNIVYYFSKPKNTTEYPIAILCTGSSSKDSIGSVIHFHRYFLQEFLDMAVGVVS